jgi:ABC-2 type transport system permease protein
MSQLTVLAERSLREAKRTPDAIVPTLLIPLFFLVVNVGQAAKIFPSGETPFLQGQNYAAFQLPSTLLLAASFATSALYLVEEIENGYFDKLRAAPVSRWSLSLGRLSAEWIKSLLMTTVIVVLSLAFGIRFQSGIGGFFLLVLLTAGWAVGYAGFLQFVGLKTRSAAATNSSSLVFFPLLFLTPNFVPRDMLTRPMEVAATFNPVTYVMEAMRSLILRGYEWDVLAKGFGVVAVFVAAMIALNVRAMTTYD